MIGGKGGSDLTQKANHPNIFRLNPDRPCEIAGGIWAPPWSWPTGHSQFAATPLRCVRFDDSTWPLHRGVLYEAQIGGPFLEGFVSRFVHFFWHL